MKGGFVVIDGLGGSGKTVQLRRLEKRLGARAVFTHEPGGAPRAEKIRAVLKQGDGKDADALTDFFLFWAARAEHVAELIVPALRRGKIVVCDRFDSSTFAMQVVGEGRRDFEKLFWQCRAQTLRGAEPDIYILLDVPPKLARSRQKDRKKGEDRFDERNLAYQERVRKGYREFARSLGKKAYVIDASKSAAETDERVWAILKKFVART